jgi:hypothetical protein
MEVPLTESEVYNMKKIGAIFVVLLAGLLSVFALVGKPTRQPAISETATEAEVATSRTSSGVKKTEDIGTTLHSAPSTIQQTASPVFPATEGNPETTAPTKRTTVHLTTTRTSQATKKLPTYLAGSIQLDELKPRQGIFAETPYTPTKRFVYYNIDGFFLELVPDRGAAYINKLEADKNHIEPTEMVLVGFVQYYRISTSEFKKAMLQRQKYNQEFGLDSNSERYELPNPDIIYTFDNEIINEYYRRE